MTRRATFVRWMLYPGPPPRGFWDFRDWLTGLLLRAIIVMFPLLIVARLLSAAF